MRAVNVNLSRFKVVVSGSFHEGHYRESTDHHPPNRNAAHVTMSPDVEALLTCSECCFPHA